MSKTKLKNKISPSPVKKQEYRGKKGKKKPQEKRKWTKMKDFTFIYPVKWLPGFRTGKHWKRIVAILYYCMAPLSLFFKFGEFRYFGVILMIALWCLPFMLCSLVKFAEDHDKYYAVEALISAVLFGADNIALVIILKNLMTTLP